MSGGGSRSQTSSPDKGLPQGAGQNGPLSANDYFEWRPHLDAYRAAVERVNRATDREIDAACAARSRVLP